MGGEDGYRPSRLRLFAQRSYEALRRFNRGLERFGDWTGTLVTASIMLLLGGWAGSAFLPITSTLFDFPMWIAIGVLATLAAALFVRAQRRLRHGDEPSGEIQTRFDVLMLATSTWFGLGLTLIFAANVARGAPLGGGTIFVGLFGAAILAVTAILVWRYIMRE